MVELKRARQVANDGQAWSLPAIGKAIDIRELGRILRRRKVVILTSMIVLSMLSAAVILQMTPLYTATSQVMISPRQAQVVNVEAVLSGLSPDQESIESEIQVIRSRDLAEKTVRRLTLDKDPEFNAALQPPDLLDKYLDPLLQKLKELRAWLFSAEQMAPLSEAEMANRELQSVINVFLDRLVVGVEGRSRVLAISFQAEKPKTAAEVANVLSDLYITAQLEAKFEATRRANQWLNDRLSGLREQVEASERAVEQYRKDSGLIKGKDVTLAAQEISELNTQLVIAQGQRVEAEARLRQAERVSPSGEGLNSVTEVLESPLIQRLREEEVELDRQIADLSQEYGELHPKMITIRAQIDDLRTKISAEVAKIVQGLRNEVTVAQAREATLQANLERLKTEVGELNQANVRLLALQREAEANRTLFETFLARSKETANQEDFEQADAQVVSHAAIPLLPSFPPTKVLLLLAVVGSGFVGLLLVFGLEQLDSGIRSMEQIEQQMDVPPLGLIPALTGLRKASRSPETFVLERPASAFAEAIRSFYTNIVLSQIGKKPPKVVLIVSPLPKEGKTAIVVALARVLAKADQKIVVVDGDLRRPRAHEPMGVRARPGLVDYFAGNATLAEIIQEDQRSSAHIISAGSKAPNPAGLLGSDPMKRLLARLAESYDLVLVDSAPLVAVADGRVLARMVDKTVFVVRWGKTRRETATFALRQLIDAGADMAGAVLSRVDVRKHARYGFGDSGYYFGKVRSYYGK